MRKELSMGSSAVGSKQAQEEEREDALDWDNDNDNALLLVLLLLRACSTTAFSAGLFFSGVTTFREDKKNGSELLFGLAVAVAIAKVSSSYRSVPSNVVLGLGLNWNWQAKSRTQLASRSCTVVIVVLGRKGSFVVDPGESRKRETSFVVSMRIQANRAREKKATKILNITNKI